MDLNITPEQLRELTRRQYEPGITALRNDAVLRAMVIEFGCNPDEIATELEAEMNRPIPGQTS